MGLIWIRRSEIKHWVSTKGEGRNPSKTYNCKWCKLWL